MEEITSNDLLHSLCRHIQTNWYASLGCGDDEKVLKRALSDFDWILHLLNVDERYIIDFYNKHY